MLNAFVIGIRIISAYNYKKCLHEARMKTVRVFQFVYVQLRVID